MGPFEQFIKAKQDAWIAKKVKETLDSRGIKKGEKSDNIYGASGSVVGTYSDRLETFYKMYFFSEALKGKEAQERLARIVDGKDILPADLFLGTQKILQGEEVSITPIKVEENSIEMPKTSIGSVINNPVINKTTDPNPSVVPSQSAVFNEERVERGEKKELKDVDDKNKYTTVKGVVEYSDGSQVQEVQKHTDKSKDRKRIPVVSRVLGQNHVEKQKEKIIQENISTDGSITKKTVGTHKHKEVKDQSGEVKRTKDVTHIKGQVDNNGNVREEDARVVTRRSGNFSKEVHDIEVKTQNGDIISSDKLFDRTNKSIIGAFHKKDEKIIDQNGVKETHERDRSIIGGILSASDSKVSVKHNDGTSDITQSSSRSWLFASKNVQQIMKTSKDVNGSETKEMLSQSMTKANIFGKQTAVNIGGDYNNDGKVDDREKNISSVTYAKGKDKDGDGNMDKLKSVTKQFDFSKGEGQLVGFAETNTNSKNWLLGAKHTVSVSGMDGNTDGKVSATEVKVSLDGKEMSYADFYKNKDSFSQKKQKLVEKELAKAGIKYDKTTDSFSATDAAKYKQSVNEAKQDIAKYTAQNDRKTSKGQRIG